MVHFVIVAKEQRIGRIYLDDEDLCREVPVDLFISEMSKQDQIHFQSYGFDDL